MQLHSFKDVIYRKAYRLCGSPEDAEDIVQETYLAAIRANGRILSRPDHEILAWLCRTASNKSRDEMRRKERLRRRLAVLASINAANDDSANEGPAALDEAGQACSSVLTELYGLPPKMRLALKFHIEKGMGAAQVASILRCSERTVWRMISKGLRRLRLALSSDGTACRTAPRPACRTAPRPA